MKKYQSLKIISAFVLLILAVVNIYVFVSGLSLQGEMSYYEKETYRIKQENLDFQEKVFEANSLQYAASKAADLEFTRRAEPYNLAKPEFALSQ